MTLNTNQPHDFLISSVNHNPYNVTDPLAIRGFFEAAPGQRVLFDLYQLSSTQNIGQIQSVFIDNSKNDGKFNLLCESSNQLIICPPHQQGYFPLIVNKFPRFNAWHEGTDIKNINVQFLNYIISQGNW